MGAHSLVLSREITVEEHQILDTRYFTQTVQKVLPRKVRGPMFTRRERRIGLRLFLIGLPFSLVGAYGASHSTEIVAALNSFDQLTPPPAALATVTVPPTASVVVTPDPTPARNVQGPVKQGPRAVPVLSVPEAAPVPEVAPTTTVAPPPPATLIVLLPPNVPAPTTNGSPPVTDQTRPIPTTPPVVTTTPPPSTTTTAPPPPPSPVAPPPPAADPAITQLSPPIVPPPANPAPAANPPAAAAADTGTGKHAAPDQAAQKPPSLTPIFDQLLSEHPGVVQGSQ